MRNSQARARLRPTKPEPIRLARPRPTMVIARPAATWLAARPMTRKAKTADSAAPQTRRGDDADHGRVGRVGEGEAGRGADDHHPFEAEIEHAGALGDDLADRGDQQRRRRRNDDHQDVDDRLCVHRRALRVKVRR